MSTQRIRFEVN